MNINENPVINVEYIHNRDNCYSDESNDIEDKFGQSQRSYFELSDAIKMASFLRFSLSEKSFYCPCGYYMDTFWLTFGLVAPERNCSNTRLQSIRALFEHTLSKSNKYYHNRIIYWFLNIYIGYYCGNNMED